MTAMDPKILAAVFASIAALTVSGTGAVDDFQNFENDFLEGIDIPFDIGNLLDHVTERPTPENEVEIVTNLKTVETDLELNDVTVVLEDFNTISSDDRSIESDHSVLFGNFTGITTLKTNNTGITGESRLFSSGKVNITQDMRLDLETDARTVTVEEVERMPVSMENVDIELTSGDDTEISTSNAPLRINSFSGEIVINSHEDTVLFRGLADEVEVGSTLFSG